MLSLDTSDTLVKWICRNISCALGRWNLHSRWNFISNFNELHVHGDERWPVEMSAAAHDKTQELYVIWRQISGEPRFLSVGNTLSRSNPFIREFKSHKHVMSRVVFFLENIVSAFHEVQSREFRNPSSSPSFSFAKHLRSRWIRSNGTAHSLMQHSITWFHKVNPTQPQSVISLCGCAGRVNTVQFRELDWVAALSREGRKSANQVGFNSIWPRRLSLKKTHESFFATTEQKKKWTAIQFSCITPSRQHPVLRTAPTRSCFSLSAV